MSDENRGPLTYSVVIPTYDRYDILPICIEQVLRQDPLPREIILVDATPGWEEMAARLAEMVRRAAPAVSFRSVPARAKSIPVQRNDGIALATADVLFLIDDDSLMYPECARHVLAVYEADAEGEVVGVQTGLADGPASKDARLPERKAMGGGGWSPKGRLFRWINRHVFMMATDQLFLPYWGYPDRKPRRPLLSGTSVVKLFQGCRMTFRRDVISKVRFDEDLQRYAAGEDLDGSYRASRHGLLLEVDQARIYHHTVATGRIPRGRAAELSAMNIAFFLRKNAGARLWPLVRVYLWLARRAGAELMKDLLSRRLALPQWRAILHALAQAWRLWTIRPEDLSEGYARMQQRILGRDATTPPG